MKWIRNEKGIATLGLIVLLPFLLFFLTLVPDLLHFGATYFSMHNVAEKTMFSMEKNGGFNEIVIQDMLDWMKKTGLDPNNVIVETNDFSVPFGQSMTLTMKTQVSLIAFRWVGMNVEVPLEVTKVGVSKAVVF